MEIIKCPNCGGSNFISISSTEKKCSYCGCITTEKKEEPQQPAQPQIIQQQVIIQSDYDEEYYAQLKEKIVQSQTKRLRIMDFLCISGGAIYLFTHIHDGSSLSGLIMFAIMYVIMRFFMINVHINKIKSMTPKELYHEGKRNPKILKY